ncbi:histidine phosphatase family protein [Antarcticibacterium flavum]|uniref:Histidine phosphatase family protein n=1 Tax=Antarcticibacterium flavum TaxID=2058175 RepID=A0A5B7X0T9_9FLAO|nr:MULTISPECIES: histidine phosphatase family protein [Antarcticibacterium]MCM4159035.1 histidine phosphatase family protein [Antarcticibacterium sp. W02-3]QCY68278.1 histidine phosphatase family protein [Antarcticibacterium flavum]
MKRLILVRHGKSSWKYNVADDKRPLKKRGFKDGELISKAFRKFYSKPVTIWTSPAVRALETAKIFKEELEVGDRDFIIKPNLYTFNKKDLLAQINTCDPAVEKLIVFGHNPAMTGLVNELGNKSFDNIPTTGLTVIDFETNSWKDLQNGETILNLFPKNLR